MNIIRNYESNIYKRGIKMEKYCTQNNDLEKSKKRQEIKDKLKYGKIVKIEAIK